MDMAQPTVLVTGISGFIAKQCALELLNAGYGVRGTVRSRRREEEVRATLVPHADLARLDFTEADLESDAGWDEAVAGCPMVLHVASPFPVSQPRDDQDLIRPAVEGTLRVLRAATRGAVRRVVQTSSMVAVMYGHPHSRTQPFTESDWTVVDSPDVTAYARSKTLAERAAREFVAQSSGSLHYSSVNPGLVLGPVLDRDIGSSAEILRMFLKGKYPGAPRLAIQVVDVRDVARMHRLALETDAPSGGRYLCVAERMWMLDLARALRDGLGPAARRAPTRLLPDWVVRLVAMVDPAARQAVPDLGKEMLVDDTLTRRTLGMTYTPGAEATVAMGRSLLELGLA